MRFQTMGNLNDPLIIMLPGSFCPSISLKYLYENLSDTYQILLPESNGHDENSTFTSRKEEAKAIVAYIQKEQIKKVKIIYGQSMGAEIGIELLHQLLKENMEVEYCFFDGSPCTKLPCLYKKLMYLVFKKFLNGMKNKSLEEVLRSKIIKKF